MVGVNALLTATTLLALSTSSLADDRKCYYPDQTQAIGDVPCGNGTNVACCGSGDICLENGLCIAIEEQPYSLSRKSCTDQHWGSECPGQCLMRTSYNTSWISIVLLTFLDSQANYCCNNVVSSGNSPICLNNIPSFTMGNTNIVPNTNLLAGYVDANSSSTSANNTESSCNATSTASSMSAQNTSATADGQSNNHDAAIGAGVGIPLGLIALASIGWALWERRKLHRVSAAHAAAVAAASQSPPKQEAWTYPNNNNQQTPPTQTQYDPPTGPQPYAGYVDSTAPSATTHQQPIVRSGQSGYSEMASSGPVELDSARRA
ncbi:hypothetical protein BGW36DRAFT_422517 [Talaromyces proteolyticus]|uniref:Mid2 domain-containing protein n=1 Tax=Talaromyces proteolyticus TaxID=1131652 RepID=A0AAD4L1T8_9EURO|nr:uncharacterized protein BGW36DRAFT_422517 [Talaromyces proteolyticus]KAH8705992.1 hypothetical protein BGW36DRAFT_422517 [Talaromyces proteolyticus]